MLARKQAIFQATVLGNNWIPVYVRDRVTDRQAEFLVCEAREAMYGGAAGGGKSYSLLMAALQYVDEPGYHALILRRTFAMLSKPDSIMATAREWLSGTDARANEQKHQWTFPSGATLTFGHMQHARSIYDYQGAAAQFVGYDELTQFEEGMYTYLFSRQRRPMGSAVPVRMRSGSNPGGLGHQWVKKRFITDPGKRAFIPARIDDNPNLDREDYLASLSELDPITRKQLEEGDWDAVGSNRFKREWFRRYQIVSLQFGQGGEYLLVDPSAGPGRRVLCRECWRMMTVDTAATAEQTSKKSDPDYTVIAVWDVTPWGDLVLVDVHRFRLEIPDILPQIKQMYAQWKPGFVAIEAVASNRAVLQHAQRERMVVREVSPRGKDKLDRARPAMIHMATGKVYFPERAHWLEDVETELLLFTGDGSTHDDFVDVLAYACDLLDEYDGDDNGAVPIPLTTRGQRR